MLFYSKANPATCSCRIGISMGTSSLGLRRIRPGRLRLGYESLELGGHVIPGGELKQVFIKGGWIKLHTCQTEFEFAVYNPLTNFPDAVLAGFVSECVLAIMACKQPEFGDVVALFCRINTMYRLSIVAAVFVLVMQTCLTIVFPLWLQVGVCIAVVLCLSLLLFPGLYAGRLALARRRKAPPVKVPGPY